MGEDARLILLDACLNGWPHLASHVDDHCFVKAFKECFSYDLPEKHNREKWMDENLDAKELLTLYTCICCAIFS